MRFFCVISLFFVFFSFTAQGQVRVRRWPVIEARLQEDLRLIEKEAGWPQNTLSFELEDDFTNEVRVTCQGSEIKLKVRATALEKVATLYHGLYHLGFLFPHPRWQISPNLPEAREKCGQLFSWRPAFIYRGFHFHTLHPNEWVKGFLQGEAGIAEQTIRWLARNRQNAIDLNLLRKNWKAQVAHVNEAFRLAKELGITRGISNGAALQQQNSWKMIPLWRAISGSGDEKALVSSLRRLGDNLDYDFLSMEFGTSEFTAVNYKRALKWMNITLEELKSQGVKLFSKIHVSTNQVSPTWGNFNFLVRHASNEIGVFPHTVMFYGLYDENVPMYGNKNFYHMLEFIKEEKDNRDIWYFPESSYWIGMDVDVPLYLTDYLEVRATDMKNLHAEEVEGHFTFTSGQELGYWLFDWTIALNSDVDQDFDPLSGIKLLGEDPELWRRILDFQTKHIKLNQNIAILSFSNLQDELANDHRIHERNTIKEVAGSAAIREEEIMKLEAALSEMPENDGVKNQELRLMFEVTELRYHHALSVRKALRYGVKSQERKLELDTAQSFRRKAQVRMDYLKEKYNRYPEAMLFDRNSNPTSYQYGYLWPASKLHFWEREEAMVKYNYYWPFYKNIYNFWDIIF